MLELNTFSIAARCERTGMLGVAVSTAVPGVGGICPFVAPGVGAVSTQSWVNPYLGIDGVALMAKGLGAKAVLKQLIEEDPGRDVRQLGIVDTSGQSAAYTGKAACRGRGASSARTLPFRATCPWASRPSKHSRGLPAGEGGRPARALAHRARSQPGRRRAKRGSPRRSRCTTRRSFPISICGSTSIAIRSPNCAGHSKSRATSCCPSSTACPAARTP